MNKNALQRFIFSWFLIKQGHITLKMSMTTRAAQSRSVADKLLPANDQMVEDEINNRQRVVICF